MGFKGKVPILILAVMLLASCFTLSSATETAATGSSRTITVPDDFPTIKEAIDNATTGDTVYVKAGNYSIPESWPCALSVDNGVSLVGENPKNTIITVNTKMWGAFGWSHGIMLNDNSTLSGFTINGNINILHIIDSRVTNNILNLTNPNAAGLGAIMAYSGNISSNVIDSVGQGLGPYSGGVIGIIADYDTAISNNYIDGFGMGIWVNGRSNVTIVNNTLTCNNVGVAIDANPYLFKGNNILNSTGYALYVMDNATATHNWWGTTDAQEIADSITNGLHTDCNATFTPFLTEPNPQAEPIQNTGTPSTSNPIVEEGVFWVAVVSVIFIVVVIVTVVFLKRKRHTPARQDNNDLPSIGFCIEPLLGS